MLKIKFSIIFFQLYFSIHRHTVNEYCYYFFSDQDNYFRKKIESNSVAKLISANFIPDSNFETLFQLQNDKTKQKKNDYNLDKSFFL